jgi:hypothetical protein
MEDSPLVSNGTNWYLIFDRHFFASLEFTRERQSAGATDGGRSLMSKWMRILIGLGIAVIACGAYLWFFGVQTFYVWETRRVARKEPVVWTTPVELLDLSMSQAPGKRLSYFGYEFESPWDDVDQEKTKIIGDNRAIIVFRSGNVISFWSGPPNGLISSLLGDDRIDRKTLGQLFGDEAAQSDYALQRAILESTPDKFSVLMPKWQAIQRGVFFSMKATALRPGAESGVFSLSTKEFRGFQYGRPQNPPNRLSVELFKSDGHVDILFGQKFNGPTTISQEDVNRVVQSVHKVPTQEMGLDADPHK